MSATDLKKTLKDLRPKFTSVEQEVEYHTAAKKALAAKERMAAVRAAKKANTAPKEEKKEAKTPAKKKVETVEEVRSAKKAALLAQLEALGSA
jgi:hypothetical protein